MTYWFVGQPYQGTELTLPTHDPALLYGATVFTTLRVYQDSLDHPLTYWEAHLARLRQALAAFHWPEPDWESVRQGATWLKGDFPILRITCFPDGRELITGRLLPTDLQAVQQRGSIAWVARGEEYVRSLPGYKTGNYLGSWLGLQAAQRQGGQEAILIDTDGRWLETSTGNLWGWAQGQWWTPPVENGLLPGVARGHLVNHLRGQGMAVCEEPWNPTVVKRFESLAYSNSGIQVIPLHTVLDEQSRLEFDPHHGSLKALLSAFWDI
jgi:branched-subunit amino acid aminotransferase/4-amino-4-deoxychorismate lyase